MAYTAKTWVTGETIEAVDLNHAEQGIAAISANGAIGTANLANASVTNDKLDQEAVDSNNIRTGAIITPLIYDSAVTTPKIADGAVTTSKLADESVTIDKLAIDTVALLDNKADIDGSYESMTVGNAEQLVSSAGIEDQTPYNFRTSGGSVDIGDREELNAVVGATVAWNQLVQTSDTSVTITSGHKYLSRINGTNTIAISNGSAISINDGTKDNVFDLTAMFGSTIADYVYTLESGTAGAGIAWLKKYGFFTKPYYPYKAAALESVKTSAHKTVGFNQFDKSKAQANKKIDSSGAVINGSNVVSDFIPVVPNTAYYYKDIMSGYHGRAIVYYDANKAYISTDSVSSSQITTGVSGYKTTPANCCYVRIVTPPACVDAACVSIRWDGERDGEYEPYEEHTYALDGTKEWRGIFLLDANNNLYADGDIYPPSGEAQRRYTIVDLGTLDWTTGANDCQYADLPSNPATSQAATKPNAILSNGFEYSGNAFGTGTVDKRFCFNNIKIWLYDSALVGKTAAQVATSLSGVYLVYELATPTTESADPYTELQICDDFGTEEFVDAETRDFAMPVGHNTVYQPNLRAKLEMAPNSPDGGDGDYIVRQTNGQNAYIPLVEVKELPDFPSNDGSYKLRCTVTNGTATLSWVSDS